MRIHDLESVTSQIRVTRKVIEQQLVHIAQLAHEGRSVESADEELVALRRALKVLKQKRDILRLNAHPVRVRRSKPK